MTSASQRRAPVDDLEFRRRWSMRREAIFLRLRLILTRRFSVFAFVASLVVAVLPLVQGFAEYTNVELLTEAGIVLSPYSLLSEYDFVEGSEVTLTLKPIPYSVTASKNHVQRLLQLLKSPPTFCDIGVESKEERTPPQPPSTPSTKNINNPTSVDSTKSFFAAPVGLCFSALPALPSVPSLTPSLSLLSKTTVTQKSQSLSQKDTLRGVLSLWTIKTHGATTSVVSTVSGYKVRKSGTAGT